MFDVVIEKFRSQENTSSLETYTDLAKFCGGLDEMKMGKENGSVIEHSGSYAKTPK